MGFIDLFPSVIYIESLEKEFFNELKSWKNFIQETDLFDDDNGFATKNSQILDDKSFSSLKTYILKKSKEFLIELGHDFEDLQISNSWGNVNPKDTSIKEHFHSNSYISGVFYLTTGSEISFFNPLTHLWSFLPKKSTVNPDYRKGDLFIHSPKPLQLILFPSFLKHQVFPSYNTRISIAFNIIPKGRFGTNTSLINL